MDHLVANLLNQYLGKYVQNLDSDNLSVSIFRGEASSCCWLLCSCCFKLLLFVVVGFARRLLFAVVGCWCDCYLWLVLVVVVACGCGCL